MRQFNVIVCPKMVTVMELDVPVSTIHIRANVDGEKFVYQIKKLAMSHMPGGWMERGYVHAYYHAKNEGNSVDFVRVNSPGRAQKKKRSPQQMQLM